MTDSAPRHRTRPIVRHLALVYVILTASCSGYAWLELAPPNELEALLWLPAAVGLTLLFAASAVGAGMLWFASEPTRAVAAYICCIVLGVLTTALFLVVLPTAVIAFAVLVVPAVAVLVGSTRRSPGRERTVRT